MYSTLQIKNLLPDQSSSGFLRKGVTLTLDLPLRGDTRDGPTLTLEFSSSGTGL